MVSCLHMNPYSKSSFNEETSSVDQFLYQEEKIEPGRVYQFNISDKNREYIKQCWMYIEDYNKISVFKIYPNSKVTYLVSSEIDWNNFSIKKIKQIRIKEDLTKIDDIEMRLKNSSENLYIMNSKHHIPTGHFPVTNHGYDFSDLNFIFRHIRYPKSDVEVGVLSPLKRTVGYTGKMKMTYSGQELYNSKECYKYLLSGDGISEREGFILVNKALGHFEYMELDANYHPLMDYFRYELLSTYTLSKSEWETFIIDKSKDYFEER